jgi:copper ion binding protein
MPQTFTVAGMSCEHCVAAVKEEVGQIAGVSDVSVELDSGALSIDGSEIDREAVRAAVEAAGYTLASSG